MCIIAAKPAGVAMPSRDTIRKDGKVMMAWDDPALTYPRETLQSMKRAGYRLYVDGKLQR